MIKRRDNASHGRRTIKQSKEEKNKKCVETVYRQILGDERRWFIFEKARLS
jgi:hypothetical protein